MQPYAIISDIHAHAWSAFSRREANGINSRLRLIINEIDRTVETLKKSGGDTVVMAGDLFHERGKIHPETFNPTFDCFERHSRAGVKFLMIPGNHDLAGAETTELGNAIQTLGALTNVEVFTGVKTTVMRGEYNLAFIPWMNKVKELREVAKDLAASLNIDSLEKTDLIIHAGINGVIAGLPDHGLDAAEVASWGFRRVFAGHYHNHKVMEGGRVISIGATTHQTWGDVGAKAGFLIVDDKDVRYHASHAPQFVQIDETTDEEEIPLIVKDNYVRVRGLEMTAADMNGLRKELETLGALGVSIQAPVKVVSARTGAVAAKSASLEASVAAFVKEQGLAHEAKVQKGCEEVLSQARARAA